MYPTGYVFLCISLIITMNSSRIDVSDYLDSDEMIAEYLNTVLEEGNESDLIVAIGNVAKAIGMKKISDETGLSRTSLYKALTDGANPQFTTVMKVLKAIGGTIQIHSNTSLYSQESTLLNVVNEDTAPRKNDE
jgi:probable addiction module antidote protein